MLPVLTLTSSYHCTFSQNDFVKGIVKTTHKLTWQVQKKKGNDISVPIKKIGNQSLSG
jgi:lipoate-protein ligase A